MFRKKRVHFLLSPKTYPPAFPLALFDFAGWKRRRFPREKNRKGLGRNSPQEQLFFFQFP